MINIAGVRQILIATMLGFGFTTIGIGSAQAVVISEIQLSGENARDEFVELYNPNDFSVDLTAWRLTKTTQGGTEANLVASISGQIQPYSFYLIAHPDAQVSNPDLEYSAASNSLTDNNLVRLYSDAGETIVDMVGLGEPIDSETDSAVNPETGESIERKAVESSTAESMRSSHQDWGNGYDTDNNSFDFVLQSQPEPQNSQSLAELPEEQPDPTPTPTPTIEPSPTPSPTPTVEPSPIPSPSPSPTPSVTPTPDPTPQPTQEPTPVPTPDLGNRPIWLRRIFVCTWELRTIQRRWYILTIPRLNCGWQQI